MLINAFEWSVARRYLTSRRKDGFISLTAALSVVAIGLGVAALIVVMSVMNGFRADLMDKILGYHGHVLVQGYGQTIEKWEPLVDELKAAPGVVKVMPFTEAQVMVTKDGRAWGAIVRGIPEQDFRDGKLAIARVVDGELAKAPETGGLIIGYQLARQLGIVAGDQVTIVSPKPVATPFGSSLRYLAFPVAAVVEVGVYQFDETFIGMPLMDAQDFFRMGDAVTNIEVFLDDPERLDRYMPELTTIVGERAAVRGWTSFNQALVGALQTERVAMFMILALIILVAVFNIASSLFMLVKDKAADIAILRTLGVSRGSIMRIFVTVGLAVAFLGIGTGCLLSWALIANLDAIKSGIEALLGFNLWDPSVRFISSLKTKVDWLEVGLTIGIAVVLSFFAALFPARRAASLDPVEVLRYE
ncbi:lipoprotein-releasing ABC transporter permease subunit [Gimibacter soli]|uniref:Lipoprotein-releasing ABC transporter permease subunit n=1 Tax=Gimibacter soli TaxID=3024400 RepID=A0AAF0BFK9_9PROT|nr:lipoprotein-releasing ABC transporter permease subunit [Gimibacter soli]WCL52603.1 lipoprotein-releasing ABC transporter permease subunit [Gimibacter soli]